MTWHSLALRSRGTHSRSKANLGWTIFTYTDTSVRDFGLEDASEAANNAFDANIVSLLQAGCFFGSLFAGPLSDKVGRKWSIMISGMVFDIGSLMQTLAYGIKDVVYVGRVVGGLVSFPRLIIV